MPGNEHSINLGCGVFAPAGWVNLDSSFRVWLDRVPILPWLGYRRRFPPSVRRWDVRRGLPFPSGSARWIYSSHMIEHLPRETAAQMVADCHRVLKSGGRLRLMTPDLSAAVEWYTARRADPALRYGAAPHFLSCLMVFPAEGERKGSRHLHHWLYDEYSLASLLRSIGFRDVQAKREWVSDFPDLDRLESSELRKGSICAEGTK